MKKIFAHFVIGMFTRDYEKTTKIVNDIYNPSVVKKQTKVLQPVDDDVIDQDDIDFFNGFFGSIEPKPKSKKDEVMESLSYLRNKPNPTKQDKESIYMLEMVLINLK